MVPAQRAVNGLPGRLFCDTSFFYACFDQHDVNHEQAKQLSEEGATVGSALYVTWDIISETLTLLRYRRTLAFDTDFRALGLTVIP